MYVAEPLGCGELGVTLPNCRFYLLPGVRNGSWITDDSDLWRDPQPNLFWQKCPCLVVGRQRVTTCYGQFERTFVMVLLSEIGLRLVREEDVLRHGDPRLDDA